MSNIDKRALREAAEKALNAKARLDLMESVFDDDGEDVKPEAQGDINIYVSFNDLTNPSTVLALLDELEAAENATHEALNLAEKRSEHINEICNRERREYDNCIESKTRLAVDLAEAKRRIAELEAREANTALSDMDMSDAECFTFTRLHEIISASELKWPEAKLLARFMLDVKQRAGTAKGE